MRIDTTANGQTIVGVDGCIIAQDTPDKISTLIRCAEGYRHNYVPRHKKPQRQARTLAFWAKLKAIVDRFETIGTRSVFYQAETAGLLPKNDAGYRAVQMALVNMRREGFISHEKISDSGRVRTRPFAVTSFDQAADSLMAQYRYDYWADQPRWVEVWCEKDGLSRVIEPITQEYGVYFAALRGFESESFTYESAMELKRVAKPVTIFYLGDHDPGGWSIARTLETDLARFGVQAVVKQLAVLPWQIEALGLPTRDGKDKDTRLPEFVQVFGSDQCVEIDAIPPDYVQAMVRTAIESHLDPVAWARSVLTEKAQIETTESVMDVWKKLTPGTTLTLPDDTEVPYALP